MILVDGDACPVKEEAYRVARRYNLPVRVVTNSFLRVPQEALIERILVDSGFDAADNWIAERADPSTIVITADILLADRCVKAGATVLGPNGRAFDTQSIGSAVATRALMEDLRAMDAVRGGPPPFSKADRSNFLSALDQAANRLIRSRPSA
ncbi:YaiI/YqxD family protein [Sphingomonas sp. C3-2]|uniref:YaiI/YqxD family protein n=1 Tax=Sphingomonas sp. C3-2 TaxID=3062169 RepID=UPI00294B34A2|nr:YaiI/YqxD family protein [Sphingomonas sp. C3-2]WOK36994.1 YaiI/YqxD family protein [Sphingomonas sp. C3-2]